MPSQKTDRIWATRPGVSPTASGDAADYSLASEVVRGSLLDAMLATGVLPTGTQSGTPPFADPNFPGVDTSVVPEVILFNDGGGNVAANWVAPTFEELYNDRHLADYAELKSLKPALLNGSYVVAGTRGGEFEIVTDTAGNVTAALAADSQEGINVALTNGGGTKYARRLDVSALTPEMFGAIGDNVADDSVPVNAVCLSASLNGTNPVISKDYYCPAAMENFHDVNKVGNGRIRTNSGYFPITPRLQSLHMAHNMTAFWTPNSNVTISRSNSVASPYHQDRFFVLTKTATANAYVRYAIDTGPEKVTFSVIAQSGTKNTVGLKIRADSDAGTIQGEADFDLSTQTITGTDAATAGIESIDGTSYLIWLTVTTTDKDSFYQVYAGDATDTVAGDVLVTGPTVDINVDRPSYRYATLYVEEGASLTNDGLSSANATTADRALAILNRYRDKAANGHWTIKLQGATPFTRHFITPQNMETARALTFAGDPYDEITGTPSVSIDGPTNAFEVRGTSVRIRDIECVNNSTGILGLGPCEIYMEGLHISEYSSRAVDLANHVSWYQRECKMNSSNASLNHGIRFQSSSIQTAGRWDEEINSNDRTWSFLSQLYNTNALDEGFGLEALERSGGHQSIDVRGWGQGIRASIHSRIHLEDSVLMNNDTAVVLGKDGEWFNNPTNTNTFSSNPGGVRYDEKVTTLIHYEYSEKANQTLAAGLEDITGFATGFAELPWQELFDRSVIEVKAVWRVTPSATGFKTITMRNELNQLLWFTRINTTTTGSQIKVTSQGVITQPDLATNGEMEGVSIVDDMAPDYFQGNTSVDLQSYVIAQTNVPLTMRVNGVAGDLIALDSLEIQLVGPRGNP